MVLNLITLLIQVLFTITLISYFILLFYPKRKIKSEIKFDSITIIIPVHNEEKYIQDCIKSVKLANFNGTKKIFVINDGSSDKSFDKIKEMIDDIDLVLDLPHQGKSSSINSALELIDTQLFAIVDGDSLINKDSLNILSKELEQKNVAAATTVIKVKNTNKLICIWLHLEQLYNSLIRELQAKINANITTPGPLSIYRTNIIKEIGGFSTKGYAEDMDIAVRLIRAGKKVNFSSSTYASTNMPYTFKEFSRQRKRFCQGVINIFSKHLQINNLIIDIYTFPILLFSYFQAVIMGSLTLYKIINGYNIYFIQKGVILSYESIRFLFNWISISGFINWTIKILSGNEPLTTISFLGLISTFMTIPLFIIAIIKYDKRINFKHIIAITFMNTFWLIVMFYQVISFPEFFNKKRMNIWKKNEK